ncbi:nitroreductase [Roseivirga sp. BDSF3-8]|uniref:nitroreductase family protein n=1 Tax=Roseivirga sp. BDSF3-8 TaxID=3241598 RepID=UPI0035320046
MNFNTEEVNKLIRNRRSIYPKMYSGEKVDRKIIEQMLENANWAPTHGKTEPWRFVVFSGEGIRTFTDLQAATYKVSAEKQGKFEEKKYEKLKTKPLLASHIIAIIMKRDAKGKIPAIEEVEATACAVQNMYLTATAYGVGCYWSSGGMTYLPEAKEHFSLEEEDQLLGFLYVGMPGEKWPDGKRGPLEEKVQWVED